MPIVYIHGVAIRDEDEVLARATKRFGEVSWDIIRDHLREAIAPVISPDPVGVPIMRIYWGDLGAQFAWEGRSLVSRSAEVELAGAAALDDPDVVTEDEPAPTLRERGIRRVRTTATAIRRPVEQFLPTFIGDVLTYVARRGTAQAPGPIPQRVLEGLEVAAFAAESRGEPLIVLTHSMGGQILYDAVTHFLPRIPRYQGIRVDFWCAAASQVGYFEELGLFLASDPAYSAATGRQVPKPPADHLGGWWNVWDHADLLSYRADGIFEGLDDTPFFAAGTLATDHNKYLGNPAFYSAFAERVRASLESPDNAT